MVRAGGYFRNIVSGSVRMGPAIVIIITLELYYCLEVIQKRRVCCLSTSLRLKHGGSLFAFAEGRRNTDSDNSEKHYHEFGLIYAMNIL